MKNTFQDDFQHYLRNQGLAKPGDKILVAVSGGVDSIVLANLLFQSGYPIGIAHCNFQLRGMEADEDEQFVADLAVTWDVPFYSVRFNTRTEAAVKGLSIQEVARNLRYDWLETMRIEGGFQCTAVAHHLDDQLETVVYNFTKGTGIRGLRGMAAKKGNIIRPLLFATKEELKRYARSNDLIFREDRSNLDKAYMRNKVRHEVIPVLQEINPGLLGTFSKSLRNFSELEVIYNAYIEQVKKKLIRKHGDEMHLPIALLLKTVAPRTVLFEILKDFSFSSEQIDPILQALRETSGKQFLSASYRLIKDRKHLIVSPKTAPGTSIRLLHEGDESLVVDEQLLSVQTFAYEHQPIPETSTIAWLDYDRLDFPLTVRKWRKGDYFYPLGMLVRGRNKVGKKKVSDYLIDRKVPLNKKDAVLVVLSGTKLAWIAGMRIDDRFKITDRTKQVYALEISGQ